MGKKIDQIFPQNRTLAPFEPFETVSARRKINMVFEMQIENLKEILRKAIIFFWEEEMEPQLMAEEIHKVVKEFLYPEDTEDWAEIRKDAVRQHGELGEVLTQALAEALKEIQSKWGENDE